MKSGVCPKCSGNNILANVSFRDHVDTVRQVDAMVTVNTTPEAWILPSIVGSRIAAWICEACGYTEFYTENPGRLGKAIDRAQSKMKDKEDGSGMPHRL